MQLKKNKPMSNGKNIGKVGGKISGLLATATCGLLNQAVVAQEIPGWYIDTAVLGYTEKDRVDAVEPAISATRVYDSGNKLNLKFVLDTLTGASPNGATISDQIQSFTRPSGSGGYTIAAGELPLDDTFKDTRSAVSGQYEFSLDRLTRLSAGLAFSDEYDYTSLGFNGSLARDFYNKNTTVVVGFAYSSDTISPEGGVPVAFTSALTSGNGRGDDDDERGERGEGGGGDGSKADKTVTDFLVGVTQVINRKTLMQFNYSFSSSDGYLTDPFKLLSVLNATTGRPVDYLYENRPDTRAKQSVYWKTKYSLDNGNVVDFSYRYLWDDWNIVSHTADLRYFFDVTSKLYVEPHLRYYTQQEAEFFAHNLVAGSSLPEFVSADYRLGAFDGITYGAKIGYRLSKSSEVSMRLEKYQQKGQSVGNLIGIQNNFDQFPDLDATIFQLSYSYRF